MKRFIVSFGLAILFAACSGDNVCSVDKPEASDSSSSVAPVSSSKTVKSSSSNDVVKSSSSNDVVESSSSADALPDTVLVDERDGQTYRIVKIGDQTWMAENLNYETENSFCYNDSSEYCETYGRLYTWAAAVGKTEKECGSSLCGLPRRNVQGVCPSGWHLPSHEEMDDFVYTVGTYPLVTAIIKSRTGWDDGSNGTDDYGFSALPAGYRNIVGGYAGKNSAYFWMAEEDRQETAYKMGLIDGDPTAGWQNEKKKLAFSVRCLKDKEPNLKDWSWDVPKDVRLNPDVAYDSVKDSRDGNVYKTVKIGGQVWMAENLNYADSVATPGLKGASWCIDYDTANCNVAGRLYYWEAAVQGACLDGWHLPTKEEWSALIDTLGGANSAGKHLKSITGWDKDGNGVDDFGFSALPAGKASSAPFYGLSFSDDGVGTLFWSSTEGDDVGAYGVSLWNYSDVADLDYFFKDLGSSVRCVKDSE